MDGRTLNESIKKRKKFLMHKGVLKSLAKETKKQKISKNAFLIAALNKAFLQYAQENLFFYFSEVNQ